MAQVSDFVFVQTLAFTGYVEGNLIVSYTTVATESAGNCHYDLGFIVPLQRDLETAGFQVTLKRVCFDGLYLWVLRGTIPAVPPGEDAKLAVEKRKLTGENIKLSDGEIVTVERSNGYVLSGWKSGYGWWAVDLRNEKVTVVL